VVFSISGVGESGANVLQRQLGKLIHDLLIGHPSGEPAQNIVNADAHTTDARPPATLAGFDGDNLAIIHARKRNAKPLTGQFPEKTPVSPNERSMSLVLLVPKL